MRWHLRCVTNYSLNITLNCNKTLTFCKKKRHITRLFSWRPYDFAISNCNLPRLLNLFYSIYTSFLFDRYHSAAIEEHGAECVRIGDLAKELDIHIVTGAVEREGGTLYCTVRNWYLLPKFSELNEFRSFMKQKYMPSAVSRVNIFEIRISNPKTASEQISEMPIVNMVRWKWNFQVKLRQNQKFQTLIL